MGQGGERDAGAERMGEDVDRAFGGERLEERDQLGEARAEGLGAVVDMGEAGAAGGQEMRQMRRRRRPGEADAEPGLGVRVAEAEPRGPAARAGDRGTRAGGEEAGMRVLRRVERVELVAVDEHDHRGAGGEAGEVIGEGFGERAGNGIGGEE
jgi:hypothetical protein